MDLFDLLEKIVRILAGLEIPYLVAVADVLNATGISNGW